jgi:glucan 1,3-beta-glucosidase
MSHEQTHAHVPYDPLIATSNSPNLRPNLGVTPEQTTPSEEFGAPNRGYFDGTYTSNSSANASVDFRGSHYGSIAPLQQNASFGYPPSSADGYRDDDAIRPDYRATDLYEKDNLYAAPRTKTKRKLSWVLAILAALLIIGGGIFAAVYFTVIKKSGSKSSTNSGGSTNSGSGNNHHQSNIVTTGGDGSVVTKDDGSTFIYNNTFGGYWVFDPANTLNNSARAQSYTPPLSEEWPWGSQSIYGYVI